MRSTKAVHIIGCHAEGEVGDVIVGGVAPPPGDTLWEQSRFIARDQTLRNFVLNEPRLLPERVAGRRGDAADNHIADLSFGMTADNLNRLGATHGLASRNG